jgi:hypothetical protein
MELHAKTILADTPVNALLTTTGYYVILNTMIAILHQVLSFVDTDIARTSPGHILEGSVPLVVSYYSKLL